MSVSQECRGRVRVGNLTPREIFVHDTTDTHVVVFQYVTNGVANGSIRPYPREALTMEAHHVGQAAPGA